MRLARGLLAIAYPFVVFAFLRWLEPRWNGRALLLAPVFVNLGLLYVFGRTLRGGQTLVERLALLRQPALSAEQVRHCRITTAVWCAFFAANAAICFALAWCAELWLWTLYTGVISYAFGALLFGAEWLVRSWRFHQLRAVWADGLLRRFFPEGPSA
jgi:uncharacterized membrane protein